MLLILIGNLIMINFKVAVYMDFLFYEIYILKIQKQIFGSLSFFKKIATKLFMQDWNFHIIV